jgi:protein-S-isoprenylcysteine O-methyltransferase Ste14
LKPNAPILSDASFLSIVAWLLYFSGGAVLLLAFFALKPSLRVSPIPREGAPLITYGIYKYFRHPMYLGVLFFGAGITLKNLNIASIILWIALLITLIIKSNFEDSLLRVRHASAKDYQEKTMGLTWRRNA